MCPLELQGQNIRIYALKALNYKMKIFYVCFCLMAHHAAALQLRRVNCDDDKQNARAAFSELESPIASKNSQTVAGGDRFVDLESGGQIQEQSHLASGKAEKVIAESGVTTAAPVSQMIEQGYPNASQAVEPPDDLVRIHVKQLDRHMELCAQCS